MSKLIKFTSIGHFPDVVESIKYSSQFIKKERTGNPVFDETLPIPTVKYIGRPKLHGTCSSLSKRDPESTIQYQSKEMIVTAEKDNSGYAKCMDQVPMQTKEQLFNAVIDCAKSNDVEIKWPITIFGEYCHSKISKKVAIQKCDPMFVIFSIRMGDDVDLNGKPLGWVDIEKYKSVKSDTSRIFNIATFPSYEIDIDFGNPKQALNLLNEYTLQVDKECPVGKQFGVIGVGEGLVWMPKDKFTDHPRYWFKTKGKTHKQNKNRTDTELSTEEKDKLNTVKKIVEEFLVESRLERGIAYLNEANHALSKSSTGIFVGWLVADICKDASRDMIKSNVTNKQVSKYSSKIISKWYLRHLESVVGL